MHIVVYVFFKVAHDVYILNMNLLNMYNIFAKHTTSKKKKNCPKFFPYNVCPDLYTKFWIKATRSISFIFGPFMQIISSLLLQSVRNLLPPHHRKLRYLLFRILVLVPRFENVLVSNDLSRCRSNRYLRASRLNSCCRYISNVRKIALKYAEHAKR